MTPDPFEDLGPGLLAAAFVKVAVLICLVSLALIGYGAVAVFHRSERCVQAVLLAERTQHLSTWEAVQRCQK